jgi:hypothetical protein
LLPVRALVWATVLVVTLAFFNASLEKFRPPALSALPDLLRKKHGDAGKEDSGVLSVLCALIVGDPQHCAVSCREQEVRILRMRSES